RLRLRTEGSNRWEKGVDPYLAGPAAQIATALVLELTGATWTAASDVQGELPARPVVEYRPARAAALIGLQAPPDRPTPPPRPPARAPRPSRLRTQRRQRGGADLARARHDARDRRRRGDRSLPARGRALHAPRTP